MSVNAGRSCSVQLKNFAACCAQNQNRRIVLCPHTVTHEHNHCAMNDETALSVLETRAHAHVHAHTHTQHAHTNSIQALHLSQKLGWSMTASVQLVIVNKPHDHKFYCTRRFGHVSCFLCTNLSTNSHTLIPASSGFVWRSLGGIVFLLNKKNKGYSIQSPKAYDLILFLFIGT